MSSDAAKPQVLVVEDDDQIAYLIEYVLQQDGYQVHRAAGAKAAKRIIAGMRPPVLVTLDISLPDGSGVDLILQVKDTPGWERVPIMMITAEPKGEDLNWAIKSGAKAYVVKPFRPEELRDGVRRVLKKTPA
jgi:DNA-binding response OmpR family regulator